MLKLAVTVGKEAAKRSIGVFVEVSTAQVYEAGKKASSEESKLKPWTILAKYKAKAEEELKAIAGLNLVIVRPAIVYGPNDILGVTPRLIIGAVYKQLGEEMKLLWTKDLKINTVHVEDVCRALWYVAADKADKGGREKPIVQGAAQIFNLCDKNDTGIIFYNAIDQGTINDFIATIFGIKTGFQGSIA